MHELSESRVELDPIRQFDHWFRDAYSAVPINPDAMTLVTVTPEGRPSARLVLLKSFDARGFVFYTNYESRKGRELSRSPQVAAVFYWPPIERQVRIEGQCERITAEESDEYFASRPRGSQIAAWASRQSEVIPTRADLEARVDEMVDRFDGIDVPRPQFWGGFRIRHESIEFWQGRSDRLHDRLRYVRVGEETWRIERLSP